MTKEVQKEPEQMVVETPETQGENQKKRKKKSKAKKILLSLFFFALFLAGAGASYSLTPVVYHFLNPPKPVNIPLFEETLSSPLPVAEAVTAQPVVVDEVLPVDLSEDDTLMTLEEPPVMPKQMAFEEEVTEEFLNQPAKVLPQVEEKTVTEISERSDFLPATNASFLLKSIELKEAFQQQGECRPVLEELMLMPNKTPQTDKALMQLLQLCLEDQHNQMDIQFRQIKKRALFRLFQNDYPTYLVYLKMIPYFLADIRQKNPDNNTPLGKFYLFENAVKADCPEDVVRYGATLPENVQNTLKDVLDSAQKQIQMNQQIDTVINEIFQQGGAK